MHGDVAHHHSTVMQVKHYPADYAAPNVLSVAATSITTAAGNFWDMSNPEYLATWSDYGRCTRCPACGAVP